MPQLVLGGVTAKLIAFSRLPDEQGSGWWARNWSAKVLLETDAESATLRTALQASYPRNYRRMINGALRGGPLIECSGDRLGATYICGVEIGEQPLEITAYVAQEFYHTLSLTLRQATVT